MQVHRKLEHSVCLLRLGTREKGGLMWGSLVVNEERIILMCAFSLEKLANKDILNTSAIHFWMDNSTLTKT